jgi:hypothetical protein
MKEKIIKINNENTNYTITSKGDVYSLNYGRSGGHNLTFIHGRSTTIEIIS